MSSINFDVAPVDVEGLDFKVATSDEPYVKAFQVDSNVGVKLLAEELPRESHWFTFVDPGRLEVDQDTSRRTHFGRT